eukprot:8320927-Ditylum_brightwellii.AAC.1
MDYRQGIKMIIAENYKTYIHDVGKPITPQNASEVLQQYSLLIMDKTKALIFDTGASMFVSFDATDFIGTIHPLSQQTLAGLSEKMKVKGEEVVQWQLRDDYGHMQTIQTSVYYVPQAQVQIFSPQSYYQENSNQVESSTFDKDTFTFQYATKEQPILTLQYTVGSNLPVAHLDGQGKV